MAHRTVDLRHGFAVRVAAAGLAGFVASTCGGSTSGNGGHTSTGTGGGSTSSTGSTSTSSTGSTSTTTTTPVPPSAGTYTSGSRLLARVYDGGGGATVFIGWYDRQLAIDCAFADTGGGDFRCLPTSQSPVAEEAYLDPACTQRGARFLASDPCPFVAPPFAQVPVAPPPPSCPPGACSPCPSAPSAWFPVGAEQAGATTYYLKGSDGSCAAQPVDNYWTYDLFALGAELPATTFVGATLATAARGPSVDLQYLAADDGAAEARAMIDHVRGGTCSVPDPLDDDFAVASPHLCLLAAAQAVSGGDPNIYAGPTCTGELYAVGYTCAPPSPLGVQTGSPRCPFTYQVVTLGPPAGDAGVFYDLEGTPATCTYFGSGDLNGLSAYPEVAPVDTATLPSLVLGHVGSGPLWAPVYTAADDPASGALTGLSPLFVDTARQALCTPTSFSDGVIRCVTIGTAQTDVFSDAACTQPLAGTPSPDCSTPREAIDDNVNPTMVYQVTGPYTGPTWMMNGTQCVPRGPVTAPGSFQTGGVVDPDTVFPRVTLTIVGGSVPITDAGTDGCPQGP